MQPFTEKAVLILKEVPHGQIATYGQIARLAGNPRAARQIARILHSMSSPYNLPWHRVVNAKGEIVIGGQGKAFEQRSLLKEEGVVVVNNKVDLQLYGWKPNDINWEWLEG